MSRELMIRDNTPVDDYRRSYDLLVKREDLSCLPPGPPFSKTRGVYAHIASRAERVIGVLDTRHSQGGHAVAQACSLLGKQAVVFYPEFKGSPTPPLREPQGRAASLGAQTVPLPAGRSAILYHGARKSLLGLAAHLGEPAYLMPNALKLLESVAETALEVQRTEEIWLVRTILVPASSATIAAGVLRGLLTEGWAGVLIVHLGYSRSAAQVEKYLCKYAGVASFTELLNRGIHLEIVDEQYSYADEARAGETPPWPCNSYYDLKTFRWWHLGAVPDRPSGRSARDQEGHRAPALLWNIG